MPLLHSKLVALSLDDSINFDLPVSGLMRVEDGGLLTSANIWDFYEFIGKIYGPVLAQRWPLFNVLFSNAAAGIIAKDIAIHGFKDECLFLRYPYCFLIDQNIDWKSLPLGQASFCVPLKQGVLSISRQHGIYIFPYRPAIQSLVTKAFSNNRAIKRLSNWDKPLKQDLSSVLPELPSRIAALVKGKFRLNSQPYENWSTAGYSPRDDRIDIHPAMAHGTGHSKFYWAFAMNYLVHEVGHLVQHHGGSEQAELYAQARGYAFDSKEFNLMIFEYLSRLFLALILMGSSKVSETLGLHDKTLKDVFDTDAQNLLIHFYALDPHRFESAVSLYATYNFSEDFAETFNFYVMHGATFRSWAQSEPWASAAYAYFRDQWFTQDGDVFEYDNAGQRIKQPDP